MKGKAYCAGVPAVARVLWYIVEKREAVYDGALPVGVVIGCVEPLVDGTQDRPMGTRPRIDGQAGWANRHLFLVVEASAKHTTP